MNVAELLAITALTLRVATVATLVCLPAAVALGYLLARRDFRGKSTLQALIALPMVLPPVAVGLGLLLLLARRGPLGALWEIIHFDLVFTWGAAVLAAAVVGFPLLVRACEQSFAEVDARVEHVARSLGLGPSRARWESSARRRWSPATCRAAPRRWPWASTRASCWATTRAHSRCAAPRSCWRWAPC